MAFYRRSLIVLCLIIILHKYYISIVCIKGKEGTYKAVYPPLPCCHSEALKMCIQVLEKLGFSGDAANTSTLAEKLVKLAKQEYNMLSLPQHYSYPGVVIDIDSLFQDLWIQ